jgi:hypothetical protein
MLPLYCHCTAIVLPLYCHCTAIPARGPLLVCGVVLRRIAKLLLFCSLVPQSVPPLPPDGKSSYVRRLWRHPDAPDLPCEVCFSEILHELNTLHSTTCNYPLPNLGTAARCSIK